VPVQIVARHFDLADAMRKRITEKAQHIRRIFDGVLTVHVTLEAEKGRRLAEVVANISHGAPVVARAATPSFAESIELAFDRAEAQLRKHKDRLRDHRVREQQPPTPPGETGGTGEPGAAAPEAED